MIDAIIVLTTVPDAERGATIARALIEERLAACVNVCAPMTSFYRWQGAVQSDEERQLVIKTARQRLHALEARIKELHPYELPELLVVPIADGSRAYLDWLLQETRGVPQ